LPPGLDESLAEFRELVTSAGAQIAGEFMQRRAAFKPVGCFARTQEGQTAEH
jgi:50S ribosomal subunit-associated GTPase HflX